MKEIDVKILKAWSYKKYEEEYVIYKALITLTSGRVIM